ncbi:MAG: biotin synthase [Acidithiobacillales bacterium SM23_46]|jgi:biotin synthase|nr:MAG: biotin synthase [Thiotrichales bacterium SG8_50]KPK72921.1 MAG: biotin synthase [Acidithiobacillales bacterium SM23_46]KPL28807.1 MAG: biotin synthase [Acidithiobacillales bacterium SM1_46]
MSHDHNAIEALFALPFNDLLFRAHTVHRAHFDPNRVQRSTLLSIKTGGCSEDCGYCSQSARFDTSIERQPLLPLDDVVAAAQAAKDRGATRFCMGAAWRGPKDKDLDSVIEMVRAVKALDLETCVTLGQLREGQAEKLKAAGLDYYNHNLDTSRAHYGNIVHTHEYDDRLNTLRRVRDAGLHVCCGGIMGMGESRQDRAAFLAELAGLDPAPESVPLNMLVKIPGTPLSDVPVLEPLEFVRTIAVARIVMPTSYVRLSAGRQQMPDHLQALCFFAGANSIFHGDRLLTTANPDADHDQALFANLGIQPISGDAQTVPKARASG